MFWQTERIIQNTRGLSRNGHSRRERIAQVKLAYASLLRKQLDASYTFLPSSGSKAGQMCWDTMRSVLSADRPPAGLLRMIKDFGKSQAMSDRAYLPIDVARVIYFLAINVARTKIRCRISSLCKDEIEEGLAWSRAQSWVPKEIKMMLKDDLNTCQVPAYSDHESCEGP